MSVDKYCRVTSSLNASSYLAMKNTPKVGLPLSNFWGAVQSAGFFVCAGAATRVLQSLLVAVRQRADAFDGHAHFAAGLHRAHADRGADGDDVARLQRQVLRDQADQFGRRVEAVVHRI